jgi:hypothetical protein
MEIRTTNRATTTSTSIVQPFVITKPISPLKGGIGLEILLLVQTFTIHDEVTIEHVVDNGKFVKDENEPVDLAFTILNGGIGPLQFLYVILPLTPHQIGIG